MGTATIQAASTRVIAALEAAGRSETTVERHRAEFNAFAVFCERRGVSVPAEADCLDFTAERSGVRLAGLRQATGSRRAQLARRPLVLLMAALAGGPVVVGEATSAPVERCPARFRAVRDAYLEECGARGNADATTAAKKRAADGFLAYLGDVGRQDVGQADGRDLAGFWAGRKRFAPKTTAGLRAALADFLGHLRRTGRIGEDLAARLPRQRCPRRGESSPHPWTAGEVKAVLDQIDRRSAIGKRDYAMILLTARLGLRVGDLRRLELGWFDWRAKTLSLTQAKTGLGLKLPVPADVGWAVIDYIRSGRPEAGCPQVFVKHRYPFTAFGSSTSAGCRLAYYARRAGIEFPPGRWHGMHSLRGALAVALLRADTPVPVVAGVLGHASSDTTAASYLRLDAEHLRCCALDVEDVLDRGREDLA
jgi:integrase